MALLIQRATRFAAHPARRAVWACLLLVAAACSLPAAQENALSAEYRVKAGFLFNFPQFVEWPAHAFADPVAPIIIGILGDDPFGRYLDELVQGEKVGGRPLTVRRFRRDEDFTACHILFLSRSGTGTFETDLARLRGRSVLTVGDDPGIERAGGMVRFVVENNKVRLRINPEATKACDLAISSKLLRLATLVPPAKP